MNEKADDAFADSEIKIKRNRRRLYDALPQNSENLSEEEGPEAKNDSSWEYRETEARKVVKNYVGWSMGWGFVPVPFLDMVAVTAVQLKMIGRLCDLYEMKFIEHRGKAVVAALIGGVHPPLITSRIVMSLARLAPGVGLIAAITIMPAMAGASTYAIGKVFIQHFESGGTFLDFEPSKVRTYFARQYKEGQKIAKELNGKKTTG